MSVQRHPQRGQRGLQRHPVPAEIMGAAALAAAAILAAWNLSWAVPPLTLFLVLCLAAPFVPGCSFFLPVIARGSSRGNAVALTFDDGPDPQTTPAILKALAARNLAATFFVTGARARQFPGLVERIVEQGHTVGNHSQNHDPLLALRPAARIRQQIAQTQDDLQPRGIRPLVFRPPAGITSPALRAPLAALGLITVNYSCHARDGGNRRIKHLARRILTSIQPGDIILLHDIPPAQPGDLPLFFRELATLLDGIQSRGLAIRPLAEIIGRPVMKTE